MSAFGYRPGAYDAWLTREPTYDPPPQPRCTECSAWLPSRPDRAEPWEEGLDCDGSVTVEQWEYDDITRGILGLDVGATYSIGVSACGYDGVGVAHEPHRDVIAAGTTEYRTCRRCRHENEYRA